MKTMVLSACMACLSAFALDTTVSNEFWCTWKYVNAVPDMRSANPGAEFAASVFDIRDAGSSVDFACIVFDCSGANSDRRFSSFPPVGFTLFLR